MSGSLTQSEPAESRWLALATLFVCRICCDPPKPFFRRQAGPTNVPDVAASPALTRPRNQVAR